MFGVEQDRVLRPTVLESCHNFLDSYVVIQSSESAVMNCSLAVDVLLNLISTCTNSTFT